MMMSAVTVPALHALVIGHFLKLNMPRHFIGSQKHVGVNHRRNSSKQFGRHYVKLMSELAEMRYYFQNKIIKH